MFLKNIQSILQERFFFKEAVDFNNDIADDEDDDILVALADDDSGEEMSEEKLLSLLNGLGDGTELSAEDLSGDGSLVGNSNHEFITEALCAGPEEDMTPTELSEHMATYLLNVDAVYESAYRGSAADPDTQKFVESFNISLSEGGCGKKKKLNEFDDLEDDDCEGFGCDDDDEDDYFDDDELLEAMASVL
ncbi:MAG: hypothetical protein ACRC0G_07755 [Fusobacteriaceae bacterium]